MVKSLEGPKGAPWVMILPKPSDPWQSKYRGLGKAAMRGFKYRNDTRSLAGGAAGVVVVVVVAVVVAVAASVAETAAVAAVSATAPAVAAGASSSVVVGCPCFQFTSHACASLLNSPDHAAVYIGIFDRRHCLLAQCVKSLK